MLNILLTAILVRIQDERARGKPPGSEEGQLVKSLPAGENTREMG